MARRARLINLYVMLSRFCDYSGPANKSIYLLLTTTSRQLGLQHLGFLSEMTSGSYC